MRNRIVVLVLLTLTALVAGSGAATAHSVLVGSTPKDGARLTSAPTRVTLRFDENVRSPSTIVVRGPSGRVDSGATTVTDNEVTVAVRIEAEPAYVGAYSIAYRVVSADGHPVTKVLHFDYAPPGVKAAHRKVPTTVGKDGGGHTGAVVIGVVVAVVLVAGALLLPYRRRRG